MSIKGTRSAWAHSNLESLSLRFARYFGEDTACIRPCGGSYFLLLGKHETTRGLPGQWYREDGTPIHFDFVSWRVVASGRP